MMASSSSAEEEGGDFFAAAAAATAAAVATTTPQPPSQSSVEVPRTSIILGAGEQAILLTVYGVIAVLGLVSNAAMIWVILGNCLHTASSPGILHTSCQ